MLDGARLCCVLRGVLVLLPVGFGTPNTDCTVTVVVCTHIKCDFSMYYSTCVSLTYFAILRYLIAVCEVSLVIFWVSKRVKALCDTFATPLKASCGSPAFLSTPVSARHMSDSEVIGCAWYPQHTVSCTTV